MASAVKYHRGDGATRWQPQAVDPGGRAEAAYAVDTHDGLRVWTPLRTGMDGDRPVLCWWRWQAVLMAWWWEKREGRKWYTLAT